MGEQQASSLAIGSIVEGTVTGLAPFGAFVDLGNGVSGMVHISEVADVYVTNVGEFVNVGDRVKVKILTMDRGRVSLSIKRAQPPRPPVAPVQEFARREPSSEFEERLSRFMKDSEDRLLDVRRNRDNRRGGSRR